MKTLRYLLAGLVVIAVAGVRPVAAEQGTIKVLSIKGAARYADASGQWQMLKVGDTLQPGVILQTAADSALDIVLCDRERVSDLTSGVLGPRSLVVLPDTGLKAGPGANGPVNPRANVIRLAEKTVLAVDALTWTATGAEVVTDIQLDLRQGKIFVMAKRVTGASRFEIKLPIGVASVRGTVFALDAQANASVATGRVILALVRPDGSTITRVIESAKRYVAADDILADLPGVLLEDLIQTASEFGPSLRLPPTPFIPDQTVYYISPVAP